MSKKILAFWKQDGEQMTLVANLSESTALEFEEQLKSAASESIHGNNECVVALEVDERKLLDYLPPLGTAKRVEVEQQFSSAGAASRHLGFRHNAVAQALSVDRRNKEYAVETKYGKDHRVIVRPEAWVRGVRWQYIKDTPE